ncbi:MAG TPA: methyltransferase domain-containing protein, partial [Chthoniobacteraceae bacterium]
MNFKDHFSGGSPLYAKFRPTYGRQLFAWLSELVPSRFLAWACATGNGQAALRLAEFFDHVVATDASAKQIQNAPPNPKIEYRVAAAAKSGLEIESCELITVAQALHWF